MNRVLSAHLATGRISNLPTVWGNVFMAFCLVGNEIPYLTLFLLLLAGSCLYVGGCYLGDAKDVAFDEENKPERPIPSGVISKRSVIILGWSLMAIGMIAFSYGNGLNIAMFIGAIPLCITILLYAWLHKSTPALGLPLIGGCRGWLVISAAAVFLNYKNNFLGDFDVAGKTNMVPFLCIALAVALYTICFASVARTESSSKKVSLPNLLKLLMLLLPCSLFTLMPVTRENLITFAVAYAIYAIWLTIAFKQINTNKGAYVSKCLAGFALLDMVFVSYTSITNMILCLVLFGLALILQKIAPAT